MRLNPKRDYGSGWEAAKQVVLSIIRESGGEFEGKTRLYKTFYFAHLYHWREHRGVLTTHPIVRMPHGPGIDNGDDLIDELIKDGWLSISSRFTGPYPETVYKLTVPSDAVKLSEEAIESVKLALAHVSGKSAAHLSEETHEHSRTWQESKDGEEQDIYLDLLTDEEYERNRRQISEARELVDGVFG